MSVIPRRNLRNRVARLNRAAHALAKVQQMLDTGESDLAPIVEAVDVATGLLVARVADDLRGVQ